MRSSRAKVLHEILGRPARRLSGRAGAGSWAPSRWSPCSGTSGRPSRRRSGNALRRRRGDRRRADRAARHRPRGQAGDGGLERVHRRPGAGALRRRAAPAARDAGGAGGDRAPLPLPGGGDGDAARSHRLRPDPARRAGPRHQRRRGEGRLARGARHHRGERRHLLRSGRFLPRGDRRPLGPQRPARVLPDRHHRPRRRGDRRHRRRGRLSRRRRRQRSPAARRGRGGHARPGSTAR